MNSLVAFATTYPVLTVVWLVGLAISIAFSLAARATHHRNVKERLARRAGHDGVDGSAQGRGDHLECAVHPVPDSSQGEAMTIPSERTRSLIQAKVLLQRLAQGDRPADLRSQAEALLRHYPTLAEVETLHRAAQFLDPAPPFMDIPEHLQQLAVSVLGREDGRRWWMEPAFGLRWQRPVDVLKQPDGVSTVEGLLRRIDAYVYT
jgi:hypothetical protein